MPTAAELRQPVDANEAADDQQEHPPVPIRVMGNRGAMFDFPAML
jgi:hypothetical protein